MKHGSIIFIALTNFVLFIGKLIIGLSTHSVALVSDAMNSLSDTINTVVVWFATKVSHQKADECHPAGHGRAQPLAAFFVAVMTAILGFEVIKEAVLGLIFNTDKPELNIYFYGILVFTMLIKGSLSIYEYWLGKNTANTALMAMSVESRGDIFISLGVLVGVSAGNYFQLFWLDPAIAIIIGLYIFYTAYEIFQENIDFLMGASAPENEIQKIRDLLSNHKKVLHFHDLYTQYLGEKIQVTVHCEVNAQDYSLQEWHDLEAEIADSLESLESVDRAFVHLDPVS